MLEFYYDFLDRYFKRKDFKMIQMDTDSNYMAISAVRLEEIMKPELREELETNGGCCWTGFTWSQSNFT